MRACISALQILMRGAVGRGAPRAGEIVGEESVVIDELLRVCCIERTAAREAARALGRRRPQR